MDTQQSKNPRRVAAGQRNGRLAANRKTAQGLAASSRNATKHLLSTDSHKLLPHEDPAVFRSFHNLIVQDLAPQDAYEHFLVSSIVQTAWKINRAEHRERIALHLQIEHLLAHPSGWPDHTSLSDQEVVDWLASQRCLADPEFQRLLRYKTQHERALTRFYKLLKDYGATPRPQSTPFLDPPTPEVTENSETKVSDAATTPNPTPKPNPVSPEELAECQRFIDHINQLIAEPDSPPTTPSKRPDPPPHDPQT